MKILLISFLIPILAAFGYAETVNPASNVTADSANTAGTLVLKDGGSGGTNLLEVDIPANSNTNSFYSLIPGEGILFSTNVYATMTGIASITVYYG